MAYLYEFEGKAPKVDPACFLAPTATLVGDVWVGQGASIWFGAVLRADFDRIVIGAGTSVQDNVVIHAAEGMPTIIGSFVTIGHLAYLEGCIVDSGALIGPGAVILQGAKIGEKAVVAAGSVVLEGVQVPPGSLVAGVPAHVKKAISGSSRDWVEKAAKEYQGLSRRYFASYRRWGDKTT